MKLKWKVVLAVVLIALVYYFHVIWNPVVGAKVALNQFDDSWTSSTGMQSYVRFQGYLWIFYILIPVSIFWKEIVNFIKNKGDK